MKRKHWLILVGIVAVIIAIVWWFGPTLGSVTALGGSVIAWILGRRKLTDPSDAQERAERETQLELDAAVDRGLAHRRIADTAANREVDNAGDLVDMLIERDPGPKNDN